MLRDYVVRTVDVQDKPPSGGCGNTQNTEALKVLMAERLCGVGGGGLGQKRKLTQIIIRVEGEKVPEGLEIYYYSRFKQQRLVGNSGCGRGEWNRGGVELPKSDNGPGPVPWKSCAGFVCFRFVGGSQETQMLHSFFFLPISTGTISVQVLYSSYSCLRQLYEWQRDAEVDWLIERDRWWTR